MKPGIVTSPNMIRPCIILDRERRGYKLVMIAYTEDELRARNPYTCDITKYHEPQWVRKEKVRLNADEEQKAA